MVNRSNNLFPYVHDNQELLISVVISIAYGVNMPVIVYITCLKSILKKTGCTKLYNIKNKDYIVNLDIFLQMFQ